MGSNPCLGCGACCAFFRVSLYWAEADDATPGGAPVELTEDLPPFFRVMKGTNQENPRCEALMGIIGARVHCSIYERRASVCREFEPFRENGKSNEACDRARKAWGLWPLGPEARIDPSFPKAA